MKLQIRKSSWFILGLFSASSCISLGGRHDIGADPETGVVTVETSGYRARFDGGTLVYLHNRLKNETMIDVAMNPEMPVERRTALYVADEPKIEPYWIYPDDRGDHPPTVSVIEKPNGVEVTFRGLIERRGNQVRHVPEAELTVAVSVARERGDLLVQVSGSSPNHLVVGSSFAYSGLTTRSINYATVHSGLRQVVDLASAEGRRSSILEWSNMNHGKRVGLGGGLWPAPVTVQASAADPKASFAVWAEDDVPRSKYLIEQGKGNAYVTYEMPPYDDNRAAKSVDWRVNVFDGGWMAAATPFADSLKRRGMADGRASWREDISLVIFANGISSTWVESKKAAFPPDVRHRILIWLPQSWRTLTNTRDPVTHDAYYWDNNFSEQTAADIRAATEAGFRVSGYTNPHYNWGHWNQVIDPDVREIVKGFAAMRYRCPVGQDPMEHGGNSLADTPYREHMLRTFENIYDQLDMSLYTDTMHQVPLCGRGRAVGGMTSHEATLDFYRRMRELKPDQFIGNEFLTELSVMAGGADYGLFFDLVWAQGWEYHKARSVHPILSYLYRDTSIQISQRVNPWSYGGERYYHLAEEMSERIGTIATSEWPHQNTAPTDKLDTPERKHWHVKLNLFVHRGLRPFFPEDWEDGVMSYLRAKDGTVFKYIETEYGSKLVEFPRRGRPLTHSARAWKTARLPAEAGHVPDWIGVADNGDAIGLDNQVRGYVLFPDSDDSADYLRLNALPENLAIIRARVGQDIAVVELGPADRELTNAGVRAPIEGTAGKTPRPSEGTIGVVVDRPLHRGVAAYPAADLTLKSLGVANGKHRYELTGNFWGDVAFIWREGVFAPFEPTDDYLMPMPEDVAPGASQFFTNLQPYDQRWNSRLDGPRNPRPGTVYQVRVKAAATTADKAQLALFLTYPQSKSMGLFTDTFGGEVEGEAIRELSFAGIRKPDMQTISLNDLSLRTFAVPADSVRIEAIEPVRFIRPTLGVSDQTPINLGRVQAGATAVSAPRNVTNSQTGTVAARDREFATVLYGVANIATPNEERPHMQEIDHVGIVLTGEHADTFSLVGDNLTETGGIALIGGDGEPGLHGGAEPEFVNFAVRFNGAAEPGEYTAAVRIVTQAGNLGAVSAGGDDEPLENLHFLDIPVNIIVE